MKKLGAKRIHTMHRPKNKIAGKLYQKMGFSYISNLDYIDKLDPGDLLMEITLDN